MTETHFWGEVVSSEHIPWLSWALPNSTMGSALHLLVCTRETGSSTIHHKRVTRQALPCRHLEPSANHVCGSLSGHALR